MCRRWGVGSYRGGQSLGEAQADPNSDTHGYSDSHADGYSHSNTYGDPDSYAVAHGEPDGYTNGNGYVYADPNPDSDGYVYADANSVTRALCTRCQCGH